VEHFLPALSFAFFFLLATPTRPRTPSISSFYLVFFVVRVENSFRGIPRFLSLDPPFRPNPPLNIAGLEVPLTQNGRPSRCENRSSSPPLMSLPLPMIDGTKYALLRLPYPLAPMANSPILVLFPGPRFTTIIRIVDPKVWSPLTEPFP